MVTREVWLQRIANLNKRRGLQPRFERKQTDAPRVTSYNDHLRKIKYGSHVLDVGCGDMHLKEVVKAGTLYVGIDAVPIVPEAIQMAIEECSFDDLSFDSVFCFACLDGCLDPAKAIQQMIRLTKMNVILLTGIGIEPDQYHTHKIERAFLDAQFGAEFRVGYEEWVHPKVLLIEYRRHRIIK